MSIEEKVEEQFYLYRCGATPSVDYLLRFSQNGEGRYEFYEISVCAKPTTRPRKFDTLKAMLNWVVTQTRSIKLLDEPEEYTDE